MQHRDSPLYNDKSGWKDWPDDMDEKYVLDWLIKVINQLSQFAEDHDLTRTPARRRLAQPAQPIAGSIAKRKLDVGFVDNADSTQDKKYIQVVRDPSARKAEE